MHPDPFGMAAQARLAQLRREADQARLAAAARAGTRPRRRRRLGLPAPLTRRRSTQRRQTDPACARSCEQ